METKSRYEVIAELETQKRDLIREQNTLEDQLKGKEKNFRELHRNKDDTIQRFDRQIEDMQEDLDFFKKTMDDKKETITQLIKSIDDSLERFGKITSK